MERGRKNNWGGEQWIVAHEKVSEGSKNRDKKIVAIK
jgi:hypothetical protein